MLIDVVVLGFICVILAPVANATLDTDPTSRCRNVLQGWVPRSPLKRHRGARNLAGYPVCWRSLCEWGPIAHKYALTAHFQLATESVNGIRMFLKYGEVPPQDSRGGRRNYFRTATSPALSPQVFGSRLIVGSWINIHNKIGAPDFETQQILKYKRRHATVNPRCKNEPLLTRFWCQCN